MNIKAIKTNEVEFYLYPDGVSTLDEFVENVVKPSNGLVKMKYLNDDAGTAPFFIRDDIKTVYVNFSNITTLEEEEVMLLSDAEFEDQLEPFTLDICEGCVFDGNPDTGCDRILTKRDKIDILEETCVLYASEDDYDFEEDDEDTITIPSEPGKIFKFKRDDYDD